MQTQTISDSIVQFVDAGSMSLAQYLSLSGKLPNRAALMATALEEGADEEQTVSFRLNQTGNIFYSTTSKELGEAAKKLFDSVTVLFAAMTKALRDKGKTLFDFDAWTGMIGSSGFFVEVQKFQRMMTIKSNSLTIDTQIVQQLIPGLVSGNSMEIAKNVLSAINGEFKSEKTQEDTKFGHLLFICEELFGAPSVTIRLFFASRKSHTAITESPCHKTSSKTFEQLQESNTFLFVSPEHIAQYAQQFEKHPEEYENLINKLSSYIK